jgi:hypothetical protein
VRGILGPLSDPNRYSRKSHPASEVRYENSLRFCGSARCGALRRRLGSAQLSNGSAVIQLENMFGQAVHTAIDYHVFLTPNGDGKGLYVSQKSATSFEVHELGGGTSSVRLDDRITAKRKGFESIRMADKTKEFTAHRPARRPAGARTPSPDQYRKEQLQKAQGVSKKKVVTTATVVKK